MPSAMTRDVREDDENALYWRRNKRDGFFNTVLTQSNQEEGSSYLLARVRDRKA